MAIAVSSSTADNREQNIGLMEMALGVGYLLGPLWGSLMFSLGGSAAPFGATGK